MPRRRWKLKDRREPLSAARRLYLELGLGGLQAAHKVGGLDLDGYAEAVYFGGQRVLLAAWREHGAEIMAAWVLEHAGSRPWGWWQFVAPEPRACLAGAEFAWKPGVGDWVWRQGFGLPGRPQLRRPGAQPARMVFESEAVYLQRLNLLVPGEAEQLTEEVLAPEVIEIPEEPLLDQISPRLPVAPPMASTNGAPRRPAA